MAGGLVVLLTVCCCWMGAQAQRASPGSFPWRFQLTVANQSADFRGSLRIDVYFDPDSEQHQTISFDTQTYESGGVYTSLEKLTESGMHSTVSRLHIQARAVDCPQGSKVSVKPLLIDEISLTSFHRQLRFGRKFTGQPLTIEVFCSNGQQQQQQIANDTLVNGLTGVKSRDCYYHGQFYNEGQSFSIGCEMQCRCDKGMVECDTMCKAQTVPGDCRLASVDRRCCDEQECQEDARWDSCRVHMVPRDGMPPWSLLLRVRGDTDDLTRVCGASIIHKSLLLTSAYCVTNPSSETGSKIVDPERIAVLLTEKVTDNNATLTRVKSITVHPDYRAGQSAEADLAVLYLGPEGLSLDENLGRINLPWPSLCKRYVYEGCSLQYTSVDASNTHVGRVVTKSKFCPVETASPPSPDDDNATLTSTIICVQRLTSAHVDKCGEPSGGGVVTKRAQFYYLLGVAAHDYQPLPAGVKSRSQESRRRDGVNVNTLLATRRRRRRQSDHPNLAESIDAVQSERPETDCDQSHIGVTNICPYLPWIKQTVHALLPQ